MPRNDWEKADAKDKARGRDCRTEREAEAAYDAAVDDWIAQRQKSVSKKKRTKRKRGMI